MELIQGTIDRFEGEKAVIRTDDSFDIIWPKTKLANEAIEGDKITLAIIYNNEKTKANEALAKEILNQIVKPT